MKILLALMVLGLIEQSAFGIVNPQMSGDYAPRNMDYCGWHIEYAGQNQIAIESIDNFLFARHNCDEYVVGIFTCKDAVCESEEQYYYDSFGEIHYFRDTIRFLPDGNLLFINQQTGVSFKNYRR